MPNEPLLRSSFFGPATLVHLLRHRAEHLPDDLAYTFLVDGETQEQHLTYRQLDAQARAVGAQLLSAGLQGERALLLFPAGLEFITGFFGCLYAGVVAVPAYPPRANRSMARIEAIARDCKAKIALTVQDVLKRVQGNLSQSPLLRDMPWEAVENVPPSLGDHWQMPDDVGPETLAFLQYTSGSTGTPKGVMLTHSNLMHNCALIAYAFEHTRSQCGVFWLPSYHDMGLIGGVLQPLYVGRPNILMSPMSFLQKPLRWLDAITRYRGSTSGGPNFAFDLCVRKIPPEQRESLDLSSWKVAFNGAEPVRADTLDQFVEAYGPFGFRRDVFYPCYGLAEATLIVSGGLKDKLPSIRAFDAKGLEEGFALSASLSDPLARSLVGCGKSLPDQEILIVDPQTQLACHTRKVGEVWVRGPSVALGYWQRPDESNAVFGARLADTGQGPYLRTGDLGFVDDELYITGRIKDLIIVHGLNHYPQDIERTVECSHPNMRLGCGAAFVIEQNGAERLVVVQEIERRQGQELDEESLFEAIRRNVAKEHELILDAVVLIRAGSVPKTSSGKIQRHACRDGFLAGTLEVVAEWRNTGEATPTITPRRTAARPTAPAAPEAAQEGTVTPPDSAAAAQPVDAAALQNPLARGRGVVRVSEAETTLDTVLAVMRRVGGERAARLKAESSFADMGVDSLERLEIITAIEEQFGGRFPEAILPDLDTVRQLADAVETHLLTPDEDSGTSEARMQEIPSHFYRIDEFPEYQRLKQSEALLRSTGLENPYFRVHEGVDRDTAQINGQELITFASFNYVGMSGDPEVTAAAQAAIAKYGTSCSASRLVSGEKDLHRELEQAIAQWLGVDDSIVFSSGHGTNESTIGHLFCQDDLILSDALCHNSINQGIKLSGARHRAFQHNDWRSLERLLADLRHRYRRVMIAVEGVYSMDGDYPDLPRLIEIKNRYKALLYVDEAHSIGVMGKHGRGIAEHFGADPRQIDVCMGTISKALGSAGGYVAGSHALVQYLKYTAPGFVFATAISPANTAAGLEALRVLKREPKRVQILRDRAELFLELARAKGFNTGFSQNTPVIPVILGDSVKCLQLSNMLKGYGINVMPILYPAVEERAARLRFFITSLHTEAQIRHTVDSLADALQKLENSAAKSVSATVRDTLALTRN